MKKILLLVVCSIGIASVSYGRPCDAEYKEYERRNERRWERIVRHDECVYRYGGDCGCNTHETRIRIDGADLIKTAATVYIIKSIF